MEFISFVNRILTFFCFFFWEGFLLLHLRRRPRRRQVLCTLCGQEITEGEDYWICNGSRICCRCLTAFARSELAPYRQTRGKESEE